MSIQSLLLWVGCREYDGVDLRHACAGCRFLLLREIVSKCYLDRELLPREMVSRRYLGSGRLTFSLRESAVSSTQNPVPIAVWQNSAPPADARVSDVEENSSRGKLLSIDWGSSAKMQIVHRIFIVYHRFMKLIMKQNLTSPCWGKECGSIICVVHMVLFSRRAQFPPPNIRRFLLHTCVVPTTTTLHVHAATQPPPPPGEAAFIIGCARNYCHGFYLIDVKCVFWS